MKINRRKQKNSSKYLNSLWSHSTKCISKVSYSEWNFEHSKAKSHIIHSYSFFRSSFFPRMCTIHIPIHHAQALYYCGCSTYCELLLITKNFFYFFRRRKKKQNITKVISERITTREIDEKRKQMHLCFWWGTDCFLVVNALHFGTGSQTTSFARTKNLCWTTWYEVNSSFVPFVSSAVLCVVNGEKWSENKMNMKTIKTINDWKTTTSVMVNIRFLFFMSFNILSI